MPIHQVYINDRPVLFVPIKGAGHVQFGKGFLIVGEEDMTPEGIIKEMQTTIPPNGIVYLCEDTDLKWESFCALFRVIEAAGGVVVNSAGDVLLIYRRGKWDLPKGKVDPGETPEQAALREVEEECGVMGLNPGPLLVCTFHTYVQAGERILKKTYWFELTVTGTPALIPQEEEDIEHAMWMSKDEVLEKVYADTYQSVRNVLENHFTNNNA